MARIFRMGPAKVGLMLFIAELEVERFTAEDLMERGYIEANLTRLLINMTEQGLLKKEDRFYELTGDFHLFLPGVKTRLEEKKAKTEVSIPKHNNYIFEIDNKVARNKHRIKEIDCELQKMRDLKKEIDELVLGNDRLEDLKKRLEDDPEGTTAIIEETRALFKK